MAALRTQWGLFVEERASEEDGGHLINRECLMLADSKAEVEEHLDPTDGLGLLGCLTTRIRFWVEPVEVRGREIRRIGGTT